MTLRSDIIARLNLLAPLTGKNFDDDAPDKTDFPYTTLLIDISEAPKLSGDGRTLATERLGQLNLWEAQADEDETLSDLIWVTLDGLSCPSSSARLRMRSVARVGDPDWQTAHRAFTFAAIRGR